VRDWRLQSRLRDFSFLHMGMAALLDAAGLGSLARSLEDTSAVQAIERLSLDGLLALWHPSVTN
jgi:protease-4